MNIELAELEKLFGHLPVPQALSATAAQVVELCVDREDTTRCSLEGAASIPVFTGALEAALCIFREVRFNGLRIATNGKLSAGKKPIHKKQVHEATDTQLPATLNQLLVQLVLLHAKELSDISTQLHYRKAQRLLAHDFTKRNPGLIKRIRGERNQQYMADRSEVKQESISNFETGRTKLMNTEKLLSIARQYAALERAYTGESDGHQEADAAGSSGQQGS